MNIKNTLNYGLGILNDYNINSSILDSELLLAKAIKKDRQYVILNSKEKMNKDALKIFCNLIERRKKGEPVAYLTNKKEFWNEIFYIDKNVLIPRPDTEIIIEQLLKITSKKSQLQVLDIGVGSGCILLSLLKERPNFYGTGIDICRKSINISKYNAKMLHLKNRIRFINSSIDNFNLGKYDIVISNPPYIEFLKLKYLDREVFNFEPKLALNGGLDGYLMIRKVIKKTSFLIKKKGTFFLEIGFNQKNKVKKILKDNGFYINKVLKDYGKHYRCIVSTKI
ncbi:peptide chain release factor N(5)-glutamine methyltransferase [Candidatus Pelagibacter sp.]|nr:peptide chain release factor N(5)-glutamine methyltransferase [Candidatus Pelagibacter sp.]